jgi:hypothetical protein
MPQGYYFVRRDTDHPREINFSRDSNIVGEVPSDQANLISEIENALVVLRAVFKESEKDKFESYFTAFLGLAQGGLVGVSADPVTAHNILTSLKEEIVVQEAPRIKNGYMRRLGFYALLFATPTVLLVSPLIHSFYPTFITNSTYFIIHFSLLWIGCMAGAWVSFGIRKSALSYKDLAIIEEDLLEPKVRLIFTGLLTLMLGMFFLSEIITITVGGISSKNFANDMLSSLVIGILSGVAEKVLPTRVSNVATQFLKP